MSWWGDHWIKSVYFFDKEYIFLLVRLIRGFRANLILEIVWGSVWEELNVMAGSSLD